MVASIALEPSSVVIDVRNLGVSLGGRVILEDLCLRVKQGEILGFVGASGSGKSVLMRAILGLVPHQKGTITMLGVPLDRCQDVDRHRVERSVGVLFQQGALFSSLTVKQNVQVPMREHWQLDERTMDQLARMKIRLAGLPDDAADKFPSELSGGMIKRAALARALALDPAILFLDEPTSGLDPIGSADFDDLIVTLRDTLGLTVFMVTHDVGSLFDVCDRIAVLGQQRVLVEGDLSSLLAFDDPWVRAYFHGQRARGFHNRVSHSSVHSG